VGPHLVGVAEGSGPGRRHLVAHPDAQWSLGSGSGMARSAREGPGIVLDRPGSPAPALVLDVAGHLTLRRSTPDRLGSAMSRLSNRPPIIGRSGRRPVGRAGGELEGRYAGPADSGWDTITRRPEWRHRSAGAACIERGLSLVQQEEAPGRGVRGDRPTGVGWFRQAGLCPTRAGTALAPRDLGGGESTRSLRLRGRRRPRRRVVGARPA
jgi:hypothetical protein